MTINEILKILPHRYPFLMVDRILEVDPGKRSKGLKNVTMNEAHFQGHYPGLPIMPGVLIIEAIAQAGAVILLSEEKFLGMVPMIGAIDGVKFRKPVVPGDQLILDSELIWIRSQVGRLRGRASVDGEVVAEMEMTFKLAHRE